MSVELHIFLTDSLVPNREQWQEAIDQLGFPVLLDPALDVREDTGFSPTTYAGKQTGFDYSLDRAADIVSGYPHIADRIGGRDACATFRWGGDPDELAAAISSAAALAKVSNGIYYSPDDDILYSADEAVEVTRSDLV